MILCNNGDERLAGENGKWEVGSHEETGDQLNLSCSSNASCFLDCRMMRGCLMREWEVRAREGEKGSKRRDESAFCFLERLRMEVVSLAEYADAFWLYLEAAAS